MSYLSKCGLNKIQNWQRSRFEHVCIYFERTMLCLCSNYRYVNGVCEFNVNNYGVYERWYKTRFERIPCSSGK